MYSSILLFFIHIECEICLHYLSSSLIQFNKKLNYSINFHSSKMFVELGCLCNMCIYFYLINKLDPVVHFRNVEVFITFWNFECIITA